MPGSGLFRSGERLCRGTRLKCGDLIVTFCSLNRLGANTRRRRSQEKGDGRRYKSQSFPQNLRMALKDYLCGKVREIYAMRCVCVAKASCKQRIIYPFLPRLQIYSTPAAGLRLSGLNVNTLGKTVNPNKLAKVINVFQVIKLRVRLRFASAMMHSMKNSTDESSSAWTIRTEEESRGVNQGAVTALRFPASKEARPAKLSCALLEGKHDFSSPELCCRSGIEEFLQTHRRETMAWPAATLFIGMSSIPGD